MKTEINIDGNAVVRGAGWFWAVISPKGHILRYAEGLRSHPAHRDFLIRAKRAARRAIEEEQAADARYDYEQDRWHEND